MTRSELLSIVQHYVLEQGSGGSVESWFQMVVPEFVTDFASISTKLREQGGPIGSWKTVYHHAADCVDAVARDSLRLMEESLS